MRVVLIDKTGRQWTARRCLTTIGYLCFDHIKPPFANQQWLPRIAGAKLAILMNGKT